MRATIAEGTGVPLYILGSSTDSAHLAAKKGCPTPLPAILLQPICTMLYASIRKNSNLPNFWSSPTQWPGSMYLSPILTNRPKAVHHGDQNVRRRTHRSQGCTATALGDDRRIKGNVRPSFGIPNAEIFFCWK